METVAWIFFGGIVGGGLAWLICVPREQQVRQCFHFTTTSDRETIDAVTARVTPMT